MNEPDLFEIARRRRDAEHEASQDALQRGAATGQANTSVSRDQGQNDATATPDGQNSPADAIALEFAQWKLQPGSRHVLRDMHAMAAGYAKRYLKTGQRVSVRLLWERERDKIKAVRLRLRARGMDLEKWNGYRLNNDFHSRIARHILDHHPAWDGLFELRERRSENN
jgi:hypothetical protein